MPAAAKQASALGAGPRADAAAIALAAAVLGLFAWAAQRDDGGQALAQGVATGVQGLLFVGWGVAAWLLSRRREGWERSAWRWFAASVPVAIVGALAAVATGVDVGASAAGTSGSPVEATLLLVLYAVLFVGLVRLGFGQAGDRAWRRALDAAVIAGSLFFILWSAIYRDQLEAASPALSPLGAATLLATPFLDAALLTVAALALGVPDATRPKGYRFLLAGLAITFAADAVTTSLVLAGSPWATALKAAAGTATLGCLLVAAATVLREPAWVPRPEQSQPGWARMLPLAALAPALGAAMVTQLQHGGLSPIQFWTAAGVIGAVVLQLGLSVRQALRLEEELRGESAFKTRLLRFISHEVANPLSPLRVQVSLLRKKRPAEEAHHWDVVDRSVERLLSLSRDVREMALAETQRLLTHVEVADVGAQVAAACQSAAPVAQQRGLELTLQAALEPLPARLDRQRFGQVVDNLLSNALKFTQPPGRIVVRVLRDGPAARVEVSDTGIGLSPSDIEGLFQPFRRAQDALAPGLGLGLYLCRAIVAELQGEVGVRSPGRGQGATFWVSVPLEGTPASAKLDLGPVRAPPQLSPAEAATAIVKLAPGREGPAAAPPGVPPSVKAPDRARP